jgi:hypothetical protein
MALALEDNPLTLGDEPSVFGDDRLTLEDKWIILQAEQFFQPVTRKTRDLT